MNIAHFYLKGTGTYRYFYLTFYHLQSKLASSRWLCRTLCKLPKQKVTFVCSFGFSRKRITRPPSVSHAGYYGRILLLGMKKRPRHIRDGMENAVGGGETPRLWGVSSKLCLLRVRTGSFCLFVRLSRSLLGLLFCLYCCLAL